MLEDWESKCPRFESRPCGFEPWLSQTNDFKMETCRFLAWRLVLLGKGKDWLAQCQDNVTMGRAGHGAGSLVS